jgi:hypothetical protein
MYPAIATPEPATEQYKKQQPIVKWISWTKDAISFFILAKTAISQACLTLANAAKPQTIKSNDSLLDEPNPAFAG